MTERQKQEANAYYEGKFAAERFVQGDRKRPNPYPMTQMNLRRAWEEGKRHAMAEERLNADTEWD